MASTVLIVTDASDVHADAVILELAKRSCPVFRFHPEDFPVRSHVSLAVHGSEIRGEIRNEHHAVRLEDVVSAWYRRPGPPTVDDSAPQGVREYCRLQAVHTIRSLYAALEGRWVASPFALRLAEVKAVQLARAAAVGLTIPETLISNDPERAVVFRAALRDRRCLVKALHVEGSFHDFQFRFPLARIWSGEAGPQSIEYAPTVFQAYQEKLVELRCVVIGDEVFAARIEPPEGAGSVVDWREVPHESMRHSRFDLPATVADALRRLVRGFDLHFASADMVVTPDGEFVFIELNPNGQWLWLEYDPGMPLVEAMVGLLSRGVSPAGRC